MSKISFFYRPLSSDFSGQAQSTDQTSYNYGWNTWK